MTGIRVALLCVRAVEGATLLVAPGAVTGALSRHQAGTTSCRLARLLGARELTEALLSVRLPQRGWIVARSTVDATHAATMLFIAATRPQSRRLALSSAALASMFAAAGFVEAGQVGRFARDSPRARA